MVLLFLTKYFQMKFAALKKQTGGIFIKNTLLSYNRTIANFKRPKL